VGALIDKFDVYSTESLSTNEEVLFEQQFKDMIGVLGNYFIGKRMFETMLQWRGRHMDPKQARFITRVDYVEYSDMIYNGSQEEKDKISFMMLDLRGQGKIDFHSYEKFWINFLYMYGELLQVKMHYNADSEELTRQTFNQLASVNGKEKTKTDEGGRKHAYFD